MLCVCKIIYPKYFWFTRGDFVIEFSSHTHWFLSSGLALVLFPESVFFLLSAHTSICEDICLFFIFIPLACPCILLIFTWVYVCICTWHKKSWNVYDAGELSRERDREKEKNQVSYMALTLGLRDSGMGIKHRRIKTTKNFLCLKNDITIR